MSTPALQAVMRKVRGPLVFSMVANPMAAGIGTSYDDHSENVTGITVVAPVDEMLDLISKYFPALKRVGTLFCPAEANSVGLKDLLVGRAAARATRRNVERFAGGGDRRGIARGRARGGGRRGGGGLRQLGGVAGFDNGLQAIARDWGAIFGGATVAEIASVCSEAVGGRAVGVVMLAETAALVGDGHPAPAVSHRSVAVGDPCHDGPLFGESARDGPQQCPAHGWKHAHGLGGRSRSVGVRGGADQRGGMDGSRDRRGRADRRRADGGGGRGRALFILPDPDRDGDASDRRQRANGLRRG